MDEIDIWRSAKLMIDRYKNGAVEEALKRATKLSFEGDVEGASTWLNIIGAIGEMQRQPGKDDQIQ